MLHALILFAQEGDGGGQGPFGSSFIMVLPILAMIYIFTIVMPQSRKQRKDQETLMSGLKKNDEVVTSSGIIGIVAHIKENADEVTLKIDDNARLRVLKSSIVRIVTKEAPKDGAASAGANTSIKPAT